MYCWPLLCSLITTYVLCAVRCDLWQILVQLLCAWLAVWSYPNVSHPTSWSASQYTSQHTHARTQSAANNPPSSTGSTVPAIRYGVALHLSLSNKITLLYAGTCVRQPVCWWHTAWDPVRDIHLSPSIFHTHGAWLVLIAHLFTF